MRRLLLATGLLFGAIACGPPQPAARCDDPGFICADKDTALECREGEAGLSWFEIPCRGAGGCLKDGASITCDVSGALEGDGCASSAEGDGTCDGGDLLTCSRGVIVRVECSSCSVSNGQVVCQP